MKTRISPRREAGNQHGGKTTSTRCFGGGPAIAAFANSNIEFDNSLGTLSGSSSGLSLSGSELTTVNGLNGGGLLSGNLGTVSFTTGALTGSLQMGGTFAAGGSFTITGNGTSIPNGVIFSGSFSSPVQWIWIPPDSSNPFNQYILKGTINGTLEGFATSGTNVQVTMQSPDLFNGSIPVFSGTTSLSFVVVPEPGTLTLLGTGLMGLAGAIRRKLKA